MLFSLCFLLTNDPVLKLQHVVDGVAADLAENGVLALELLCGSHSEEELAPVVVFARVGHSHETSPAEPEQQRDQSKAFL